MAEVDDRLGGLIEDVAEPQEGGEQERRATALRPSISIDVERCVGCAACMRACPMEAIRIRRDGKALIKPHLCIDCGECVRVCSSKAVVVLTDPISSIHAYRYRIAVPEASLYGQFAPSVLPNDILCGLLDLGFSEVYEAALAAERFSLLLREYVGQYDGPRPLITSLCPVVVRLMRMRFPELLDRVIPIDSSIEMDVRGLKLQRSRELGIPVEQIGAFYLAGCPARITNIHSPHTGGRTYLDGAISIAEIYKELMFAIKKRQRGGPQSCRLHRSSGLGILWGTLGGEIGALGLKNAFAVSDIKHLIRVIEEIDNQKLSNIDFVECRACYGGCTGGPLLPDNPYMARAKVQMLSRMFSEELYCDEGWGRENFERHREHFGRRLSPLPTYGLDPEPAKAIEKLARRAEILRQLPGIDCGICGAPSCKALADDIVRGEASIVYCLFKLRDSYSGPKRRKGKGKRRE
jgi:ferredoxin